MTGSQALVVVLAATVATAAAAGDLFCDDLSGFPATEAVDYQTQIQPLFGVGFGECTNCHGGLGGLFLTPEQSYDELFCAPTETFNSPAGSVRVVPRDPNNSWLLLRVTCERDGDSGFRMPQGSAFLTGEEKRLIFDWIRQGAYPSNEQLFDGGFEAIGCSSTTGG